MRYHAFFNRLLIPVGLHHALNLYSGLTLPYCDIPNYLRSAVSMRLATVGVTVVIKRFLPVMMFGLPGAALTIYRRVKRETKQSCWYHDCRCIYAFFTGITDFADSPLCLWRLYMLFTHSLIAISVYILVNVEWISGFGFSCGLSGYVIFINPLAVHWYMLIVQGLFSSLSITVFSVHYHQFNLKIGSLKMNNDG